MALNKKNMQPPVPAMKVPTELCPAAVFEHWPIENTKPHPRNARHCRALPDRILLDSLTPPF